MGKIVKQKPSQEELEFFKFFGIHIKDQKQIKKLNDREMKQYFCRLKRWEALLETQLDFEKYKTKSLLKYNNELVAATNHMIQELRSDPEFEEKYEKKYGKELIQMEKEIKECVQEVELEKLKFIDLCKEPKIKKEIKDKDEEEVETKSSFEVKKEIKSEIKHEMNDEYDCKPNIKKEFKVEVKLEPKEYEEMDVDVKPYIKSEVKEEVLSSDSEEDY